MHLLWSWVWPITPMIAEWTNHSWAGNGQSPSQTILVVGGRRHIGRVVSESVRVLILFSLFLLC